MSVCHLVLEVWWLLGDVITFSAQDGTYLCMIQPKILKSLSAAVLRMRRCACSDLAVSLDWLDVELFLWRYFIWKNSDPQISLFESQMWWTLVKHRKYQWISYPIWTQCPLWWGLKVLLICSIILCCNSDRLECICRHLLSNAIAVSQKGIYKPWPARIGWRFSTEVERMTRSFCGTIILPNLSNVFADKPLLREVRVLYLASLNLILHDMKGFWETFPKSFISQDYHLSDPC